MASLQKINDTHYISFQFGRTFYPSTIPKVINGRQENNQR